MTYRELQHWIAWLESNGGLDQEVQVRVVNDGTTSVDYRPIYSFAHSSEEGPYLQSTDRASMDRTNSFLRALPPTVMPHTDYSWLKPLSIIIGMIAMTVAVMIALGVSW